MERILLWLSARPGTTKLLTAAYVLLVVGSHEFIQRSVIACYDRFSRESVNMVVRACGVGIALAFVVHVARHLSRPDGRWTKIVFLIVTLGLIAASWPWLFYTDIEVVHFPQYAILSVLLYAVTRRFGRSMFYASLIGAADECFQFYVSHPNWSINLDFNDMMYNTIGAGFGCTMIYLAVERRLSARRPPHRGHLRRAMPLWTVLLICMTCGLLWQSGQMSLDPLPDGSKPRFVVRRHGPSTEYWERTGWGKRYHELSPFEAGGLAVLLIVFYGSLDFIGRDQSLEPAGDEGTAAGTSRN
ncbi:MAG: VanZ family protein [Planctomycetia bacterium]|nr:VanZ family protein [Planctomycetia bacterium]MCC7315053.1 VanZ family protein [Planctomycetota bacterium]